MRKGVKGLTRWWGKELRKRWKGYGVLAAILGGGLFVRVYRLGDLLGFYYDQGRDGLVVWDLWHKGRLFLIGPTTGIEGIFLGPLYYYLIAPFYLGWGGNPVGPAIFLALTNIAAIYLLFCLLKRHFSFATGLLGATVFAFSYYLVLGARWLSNPTPLTLASVVMLWGLDLVGERKKWGWVVAVGAAAAGLQFEAASATFFLPALFLFGLWQRRKLDLRVVAISAGVFVASLLPQIWFNFRHGGILVEAFERFLVGEKSFRGEGVVDLVSERLVMYRNIFGSKLLPSFMEQVVWWVAVAAGGLTFWKQKETRRFLATVGLVLVVPIVFMMFYQGNYGRIWDYYFTGVFPLFILLFAAGMAGWGRWNRVAGIGVVAAFLVIFGRDNGVLLRNYLRAGVDGPTHITLGNMKQAVDWVFRDAGERQFNVDVYVPPVIPHSYDYLFLWMGKTRYGKQPKTEQVSLLYTLYEVDPPHPERLVEWMGRQEGIGKIEEEVKLGGVGVQRRSRIQ